MAPTRVWGRSAVALVAVFMVFVGVLTPASAQDFDPELPGIDIVGGEDVTPGAYPFMVALVSSGQSDAYLGQYCGGSVLNANWIITAGHCVIGDNASQVDLVIGRDNLRSNDGERIGAKSIVLHPNYNDRTLANDIALIELDSPTSAPGVVLADSSNTSLWAPGEIGTVIG